MRNQLANLKSRPIIIVSLIVTLSVIVYIYLTSLIAEEKENEIRRTNERVAQTVLYRFLQNSVYDNIYHSGLFDPLPKNMLVSPSNYRIEFIGWLKSLAEIHNASIVYLLDKNGTVIASSNEDTQNSLTGKSFSFRPYFQETIAGKRVVYPAIGVTTKERGVYYSAPVFKNNRTNSQIVGVLVVKVGLEAFDEFFSKFSDIVLLLTPEDVTFSGNKPELLFHHYDISIDRLKKSIDNKQYGENFKGPLSKIISKRGGRGLFWNGRPYFETSHPIPLDIGAGHTWRLVMLSPKDRWVSPKITWGLVYLTSALILCVIYFYFFQQKKTVKNLFTLDEFNLANSMKYPFIITDVNGDILYTHPEVGNVLPFIRNISAGKNFVEEIVAHLKNSTFSTIESLIHSKSHIRKNVEIKDFGELIISISPYPPEDNTRRVLFFDVKKIENSTPSKEIENLPMKTLFDSRAKLLEDLASTISDELTLILDAIANESNKENKKLLSELICLGQKVHLPLKNSILIKVSELSKISSAEVIAKSLQNMIPFADLNQIKIIKESLATSDQIIGTTTQLDFVISYIIYFFTCALKDQPGSIINIRSFNSSNKLYIDLRAIGKKPLDNLILSEQRGMKVAIHFINQMGGKLIALDDTSGVLIINLEFPAIRDS